MILLKNTDLKLCFGLTLHEFKCRCSNDFCRAVIVSDELLDAYEKFRMYVTMPLKINSGHRCQSHNFDVNGVPDSRHIEGRAIDIDAKNLLGRYTVDEIKDIALQSGFEFVKFYEDRNFFHYHL